MRGLLLLALLGTSPAAFCQPPEGTRPTDAVREAFLTGRPVPEIMNGTGTSKPEVLAKLVKSIQAGSDGSAARQAALRAEIDRVAALFSPPATPSAEVVEHYLRHRRGSVYVPPAAAAVSDERARVLALTARNYADALGTARPLQHVPTSGDPAAPEPAWRQILRRPEGYLPVGSYSGIREPPSLSAPNARPIWGVSGGDLLRQTGDYLNSWFYQWGGRTRERTARFEDMQKFTCSGGMATACAWSHASALSGHVVGGFQELGAGLTGTPDKRLKTVADMTPAHLYESLPMAGTAFSGLYKNGMSWQGVKFAGLATLVVGLDLSMVPGRKAVAGAVEREALAAAKAAYKPEVFTAQSYTRTLSSGEKRVFESKGIGVSQAFDESGRLQLTVGVDFQSGRLNGTFTQKQLDELIEPVVVPHTTLANGLRVRVDGVEVPWERVEVRGFAEPTYLRWSAPSRKEAPSVVEMSFHDQRVGLYSFDPATRQLTRLEAPRSLSAFDLRQFHAKSSSYIDEWKVNPALVERDALPANQADLHTHFAGALRAESILEVARRSRTPYPVELLEKAGVQYKSEAVFMVDGKPHVRLDPDNFHVSGGLEKLEKSLSIPPGETITFQQMETIYALRSPLVKNKEAFGAHLSALAADYKRQGVRYAELSISDVLKPEWLAEAHRVLPRIEKETGVKLRFVAGLWRHSDPAHNDELVKKIIALKDDRFIVGVDFMGEETNRTLSFAAQLSALAEYRRTARPDFQIRVHAGENGLNPDNIKEAIRLGATRVGHGVYGVDAETLRLARQNGVIIEFNSNSNLALRNIDGKAALPVKEYLDAGVRVTLGTDGHGLYHTSARSEEAVMRSLGLTSEDLAKITASDRQYMDTMAGAGR